MRIMGYKNGVPVGYIKKGTQYQFTKDVRKARVYNSMDEFCWWIDNLTKRYPDMVFAEG